MTAIWKGVIYGGPIEFVVNPERYTIYNLTLDDRVLNPGYIMRSVQVMNGVVGIQTVGYGTGRLPRINEKFGSYMFGQIDKEVVDHFKKK